MALLERRLPVLRPKTSSCEAVCAPMPTRVSHAMRVNTQPDRIIRSAAANHQSHHQVIFALHSLQNGLSNVQNGLTDLLNAYTQHTTSILAGEDNDYDRLQLPASIAATANATMEAATLAANGINQVAAASNQVVVDGAAADGKTKKRKREKKEKDPNAPKKPLTAAFLYAQTARSIVRADLESGLEVGQALEKNAVNLETTKRWNELPDEEKEVSGFCLLIFCETWN
jgi:hypothetical protein